MKQTQNKDIMKHDYRIRQRELATGRYEFTVQKQINILGLPLWFPVWTRYSEPHEADYARGCAEELLENLVEEI